MPSADVPPPFPSLLTCKRVAQDTEAFDVKFYPYAVKHDEQIFAVVTGRDTIVCRPSLDANNPYDILKWHRHDQGDSSWNSIAWTKDPVTDKPWLCVAGATPKHITILDVESDKAVRTLSGHGRSINDLAVSPLSTSLLASCAEDKTVRLWNLEPSHADQPCVALLSGAGHSDPVLAIHFHPNGRWLLSGGIDNAVCLWAIPSLDDLRRHVGRDGIAGAGEPRIIYYPHFFTQEIHPNYVDCLAFYGDLIVSRAARDQKPGSKENKDNNILIWKIDGFDSDDPPPARPPIPTPGARTRSSFPHETGFRGFQRRLTLSMDHTDRFYHRFGLLCAPGMRAILAMGDQESYYHFWDLQRLEEGVSPQEATAALRALAAKRNRTGPKKLKSGSSTDSLDRLDDLRKSEDVAEGTATSSDASMPPAGSREFTLSDPFTPIVSHHKQLADTKLSSTQHFATSQIAWSPDGTWMVGVGDHGMICIFHRDRSAVNGVGHPRNVAF